MSAHKLRQPVSFLQNQKRSSVRNLLLLVLGISLAVSACGSNGDSRPRLSPPMPTGVQADDVELLQGRRVFKANCARCHGVRGQGGFGPTFRDGRLLRDFPSPQDQVLLVGRGRGGMPSFGGLLTNGALKAVVRYEREVLSVEP